MSKEEKILESALALFVEFGFHGTPTSKIAKNAGVSNGILFHYFKTKEELIIALYVTIKSELMNFIEPNNTIEKNIELIIKETLISTILWALEHKNEYYYIQQVHFSPHIFQIPEDIQNAYLKSHITLIEKAKSEKIIKDLPSELILSIINGHVNSIYQYYSSNIKYSNRNIID